MNIDLGRLDAAELALISKMAHVDPDVRDEARITLRALAGVENARKLQAGALTAIDQVSAIDAALYAEAQS